MPRLLDGGWATELQRRGLALGESADAWNLSRPDDVLAVARSYVDAGAEVLLTNTFQANPIALARRGLSEQVRRINLEGAALSREAAGRAVKVFGSVGPVGLGRDLECGSPGAERRCIDAYARQIEALADGEVDAIVLETCCHIGETRLAVRAARDTGLPAVVSFYFDTSKGEPCTPDGASPEQAAFLMSEEGVLAVGANCGAGPAEFVAICRRLRAASKVDVWIKPNAGLPTIIDGLAVYSTSPEAFASYLPAFTEAGARYVGGCCGTTPAFIQALRHSRSRA